MSGAIGNRRSVAGLPLVVMAGLVPAIHDFLSYDAPLNGKSVDGRHKPGHDGMGQREALCHA